MITLVNNYIPNSLAYLTIPFISLLVSFNFLAIKFSLGTLKGALIPNFMADT